MYGVPIGVKYLQPFRITCLSGEVETDGNSYALIIAGIVPDYLLIRGS